MGRAKMRLLRVANRPAAAIMVDMMIKPRSDTLGIAMAAGVTGGANPKLMTMESPEARLSVFVMPTEATTGVSPTVLIEPLPVMTSSGPFWTVLMVKLACGYANGGHASQTSSYLLGFIIFPLACCCVTKCR